MIDQAPVDASTPLTPSGVIERVIEIYRDQAQTLVLAALIVYLVNLVATLVFSSGAFIILATIVSTAVGVFYQGMVVELVSDLQDGRRDSSIGQLFGSVQPVALTLFLVSLLGGLAIGIGFVLLIVPGLFLLTIWALIAPVVVVENTGVFATFGRSRALVAGHGWTVFGVIAIVFVLTIVVFLVAGIFSALLGDVGGAIVRYLVSALLAPVGGLAAAVLYFRLRDGAPVTAPLPVD
jgi:hypothetical protein